MNKSLFKEIIVVSAIFLIFSLILYFPIFSSRLPFNGNLLVTHWSPWKYIQWSSRPFGIPSKFMGVDEIREFYPLLDFTYDSFRNRQLPLWNPYNFSGYPHLANWASAVFYPLHIVFFILSKNESFIFLKLSSIVLSGVLTYLYLRSISLRTLSSLFGGISFAFSATMLIWGSEIWESTHSFLWLPLILLGTEKFISTKRGIFVVLVSLGVGLSVMGGYIQPTIYLMAFSLIYALFRGTILNKEKRLWGIVSLLGGFILGLGMSSIQLLPSVEAYLLSPRSQVQLKDVNSSLLLPLKQMLTIFIPDLFGNIATLNWFLRPPGQQYEAQYYENMIYIGVIPIAIAFLAYNHRRARSYVLFFAISAIITLSMVFNLPTSKLIYDFSIPFLSSAIPIRIILVFCFCISVLSALGIDWWMESKRITKTVIPLIFPALVFACVGGFILYAMNSNFSIKGFPERWYEVSFRNYLIPFFFFSVTTSILILGNIFNKYKNYLTVLIIFLTFIGSFLFFQKYVVFSDREFFYPKHDLTEFLRKNQGLYRYWGYGSAAIPNNFATVYKIYSPEGYDPVNIGYYNELLSSSRGGKYEGSFSRSDALLYAVTEFPFKDISDTRYRIMDILGVKYIGFEKGELSKIEQKRLDSSRYAKSWEKNNFIVFENRKVFPRVFLADRFILRPDKKESLKEIYNEKINLRNTVIVPENLQIEENKSTGSAEITSYASNKVIVETKTKEQKILVLTDAFYPGWKAKVNDVETKIYRVNYALRGIILPAGENNVVFFYAPLSFKTGAITTIVSIIILLSIIVLNKRRFYGTKT